MSGGSDSVRIACVDKSRWCNIGLTGSIVVHLKPVAVLPSRRRLRLHVPALALSLITALSGQQSDRELCRHSFFRVVSPDGSSVSQEQCQAIAAETAGAWRFDADRMRWSDAASLEKAPVTLRLLSVARMKTEHPGLYGFARGRDLFVVSLAVLDRPFSQGTLAHEIGHIQAKRAMGQHSEQRIVPGYFMEGHGNAMGRAYRDHLQIDDRSYDAGMARRMAKITAADAALILSETYRAAGNKEIDTMEAMGVLFVEYLRTRYRGRGIADVIPRMGAVFEAVGRGETYQNAFERQFGASVGRATSEMIEFLKRTEADPGRRLSGTLYAKFL